MSHLPCLEVEPYPPAEAAVIWLHGLGADGHDFETIVPELRLPERLRVRFVFPHAPSIPVTINGGFVMPAWYDIVKMEIDREVDTAQLVASAAAIGELIEREIDRGIGAQNIVIAGFSQGGAVAYEVALTYPRKLAGLMTMSSYFATSESIHPSAANASLPIQIFHGTADPIVPESLGRKAVARLQEMGYEPGYKTYPMEHGVHPHQVAAISTWLQGVL